MRSTPSDQMSDCGNPSPAVGALPTGQVPPAAGGASRVGGGRRSGSQPAPLISPRPRSLWRRHRWLDALARINRR